MSNKLIDLPEKWEWAKIGDIGDVVTGSTPPKKDPNFFGGDIPFYKPTDLDAGYTVTEAREYLSELGAAQSRLLPALSVLVTCIGATIGKVGLARKVCTTNQQINAVSLLEQYISPHWFFWMLNSPMGQQMIVENASATTLPIINKSRFSELILPIPPLNEQKRIVAKIEVLRERSQRAREALEEIPGLCDRFRQSVLAAAFRGDLTADWREQNPDVEPASVLLERISEELALVNQSKKAFRTKDTVSILNQDFVNKAFSQLPKNWQLSQIRNICISSFYGPRFGKDEYVNDGIPSIRTTDMTDDGEIILRDAPKLKIPPHRLDDLKLLPGDLLVTRSGSIGMMAVFKGNYLAIPSAYIIRFRFCQLISADYIFYFLKSPIGQTLLGLNSTAVTQSNINAEAIKDLPIPLPSIKEQKEIVYRIKSVLKIVAQFKQQYEDTKTYLDQLDQSILAKAFRGELVPQDPNDEPASVLLERIKAEREQLGEKKKTTRKSPATRSRKAKTETPTFEQMTIPGLEIPDNRNEQTQK